MQGPAAYYAVYPNCNWLNADCNGDGTVDFADIDAFNALLTGGNEALAFTLVWDGENRLTERRPTFPDMSSQKVTCTYDYQGRRVEKKVYNWTGSQWQTTASLHRKFVWDGWKLLLELNGLNGDAVLRKYTYGLDVSGRSGAQAGAPTSGRSALEGAGTIGGVLATYDTNGTPGTTDDRTFVYCYDANGNVGQLIQTTAGGNYGTIAAKYEYDPYGARTNPAMIGEFAQPFRFSTKYFDAETGFLYFGGRYYQPSLGRWLNRDPIGEAGGANLYAFVGNDPIDRFDPLGYVCGPRPEDCGGGGGSGGNDSGPWACVTDGEDDDDPFKFLPPPWAPPRAARPQPPPDCSDCWTFCESDEVQKLMRRKGLDGAYVCRPDGCKCACVNYGDPKMKNPPDRAHALERSCIIEHEEEHGRHWSTCALCFRPPCVAIALTESECYALHAQWECLIEAANFDKDCAKESGCVEYLLERAADILRYAKDFKACDTSYWTL